LNLGLLSQLEEEEEEEEEDFHMEVASAATAISAQDVGESGR